MDGLHILVVHQTVMDAQRSHRPHGVQGGQVGWVHRSTPNAIYLPPGCAAGAKVEPVSAVLQDSHVEVEADHKDIPADPCQLPRQVYYYIFSFVLVGAKEAKYHEDEVEEVGDDW